MKSFIYDTKLTKHKYLEIQFDLFPKDDWVLFAVSISHSLKGDHCGFQFRISSYHIFSFHLQIYDHRHWDWEQNCWEKEIEEVKIEKEPEIEIIKCFNCETEIATSWYFFNGQRYCPLCIDGVVNSTIKTNIK